MNKQTLFDFALNKARHPEGFEGLFEKFGYLFLLPLLEFSPDKVLENYQHEFQKAGISIHAINRLSFDELIEFALNFQSSSGHWQACAITWLETDYKPALFPVNLLDEVSKNKMFSQNIRHRAFRLARKAQNITDE